MCTRLIRPRYSTAQPCLPVKQHTQKSNFTHRCQVQKFSASPTRRKRGMRLRQVTTLKHHPRITSTSHHKEDPLSNLHTLAFLRTRSSLPRGAKTHPASVESRHRQSTLSATRKQRSLGPNCGSVVAPSHARLTPVSYSLRSLKFHIDERARRRPLLHECVCVCVSVGFGVLSGSANYTVSRLFSGGVRSFIYLPATSLGNVRTHCDSVQVVADGIEKRVCHKLLFVGCLTSQQQASVSQGRICSDNFTCCHTETEAADQTFHLTKSHYTDTAPTSPSADPITPGAW